MDFAQVELQGVQFFLWNHAPQVAVLFGSNVLQRCNLHQVTSFFLPSKLTASSDLGILQLCTWLLLL
jgi:hypothetical protein